MARSVQALRSAAQNGRPAATTRPASTTAMAATTRATAAPTDTLPNRGPRRHGSGSTCTPTETVSTIAVVVTRPIPGDGDRKQAGQGDYERGGGERRSDRETVDSGQ